MDVQKYIKKLKFARADWSRNIGDFKSKEDAIDFLNSREFFFGDPFVVKYTENGKATLLLAIGKSENPTVTSETTEVTGGVGPDAYELFELGEIREELAKLKEDVSANTEAIEELKNELDALEDVVGELSGATGDMEAIIGSGWTDEPDNVTITDRIKRDEELAGIKWGHDEGEPFDGRLDPAVDEIPGNSVMEKLGSLNIASMAGLASIQGQLDDEKGYRKAIKLVEIGHDKFAELGLGDDVRDAYFVTYHKPQSTEAYELPQPGDAIVKVYKDSVIYKIYFGHVDDELTSPTDPTVVDGTGATAICFIYFDANGNYKLATNKFNDLAAEMAERVEAIEETIQEEQDVMAIAINRLAEAVVAAKTKVELGEETQHIVLDKTVGPNGEDIYLIAENNIADSGALDSAVTFLNIRCDMIQGQLDDEKGYRKAIKLVEISHDKFAELGLGADVRDAYFVTYHKPQSTEPYEDPQPGDAIVKVYKDSVIYRIYLGHVDDQITSPTDPTVIPGSGETAICFIYFNANGEYQLTANDFDLGDAFNELKDEFEAFKDETDANVARLDEAVTKGKVEVELESGTTHITLDEELQADGHMKYVIGENQIAGTDELQGVASMLNMRCDMIQGQLDDEKGYRKSIKLQQLSQAQIEELYGAGSNVLEAYYLIDHHQYAPTMQDTIVKVYKDSVTVQDMDSFDLGYDSGQQDLVLTWQVGDIEHSTRVDVSDFVKDSFLEGVQVVTRDGELYLEFRFKTYDGEPVPIYIPLSDFAVIYKAGDGIDAIELIDNQIITVKIDPMHEGENSWLAKSEAGLRVTGLTEYIDEKIEDVQEQVIGELSGITEVLEEYVRKDEVEDHLDSASTLPVQNGVIVDALNGLSEDFDGKIDDIMDAISGLTGGTFAEFVKYTDVEDHLDSASTLPVQNKVVTEAIEDVREDLDNIMGSLSAFTADTIYANEYYNLPTATTDQYGIVIIDDNLDSGSTNPVANSAITKVIIEDEKAVSAALNDLNTNKASKSELDDAISDLRDEMQEVVASGITEVDVTGSGNVVTNIGRTGSTITVTMGSIIIDSELDSASTNPVENRAITKVILEDEEAVSAAFNDLNDRKADKSYVDNAVASITIDVDDHLDSASTNPVENRVVYQAIEGINENIENNYYDKDTIDDIIDDLTSGSSHNYMSKQEFNTYTAATSNEFVTNNLTAQTFDVENVTAQTIDVDNLTAQTIYADEYYNLPTASTSNYGVVMVDDHLDSGSTNPVQNNVIAAALDSLADDIAALGNDMSSKVDVTNFEAYTASTLNDVSANTGAIVVDVEKDGDKVKVTKSNTLDGIAGITATTVSATTYENLPVASGNNAGIVTIDSALTENSANPVANSAVTRAIIDNELVTAAALNDLNNRKANIEDVPVSLSDLNGYSDVALKSDLGGYLPLSGGTMTGDISGDTGVAVYMPGGFFQQSDESLKIFAGDIENALEKANMIPTKYFYWLSMPDGPRNIGTSAQKVQELFPEIVSGAEKLSVDYSKLAVVALAAIKELTAKVDDLQKQLDELKK